MANLGSLGSLFIDLAANTATFESDLGRAERIAAKRSAEIQARMDALGKSIAGALVVAGTASIGALASLSRIAEQVGSYKDLADSIGDTAEAVASLKAASATSDTSLQSVAAASVKLTASLSKSNEESKGAADAIRALGLDFNTFKDKAPVAQLETIARRLAEFEDGAGKTAVAVALFGRSGAELIPFLNDLGEQTERQIGLNQQQIDGADEYGKKLGELKGQFVLLGERVAVEALPTLREFQRLLADKQNIENIQLLARGLLDFAVAAAKAATATADFTRFLGESVGAFVAGPEGDVVRLSAAVDELTEKLAALRRQQDRATPGSFGATSLDRDIQRVESQLKLRENQLRVLQSLSKPSPQAAAAEGAAPGSRGAIAFGPGDEAAAERAAKARVKAADIAARLAATEQKRREQDLQDAVELEDAQRKAAVKAADAAAAEIQRANDRARALYERVGEQSRGPRADANSIGRVGSRSFGLTGNGDAARGDVNGEYQRAVDQQREAFAQQLEQLEAAHVDAMGADEGFFEAVEAARKAHNDRLLELDQARADASADIARNEQELNYRTLQGGLNAAGNLLGALADLQGSGSEKAFKRAKALQIAQATVNTISGAIGAFTQAVATIPPPFGQVIGAAQAAAVTAAGFAQIGQIRAQQFTARRYGGQVSGGGLYEVAEANNPELLRYGNKTLLAMGDQSGTVTPAKVVGAQTQAAATRATAAGPMVNFNFIDNVGVSATRGRSRRNPDGTLTMEVLINELDDNASDLAQRVSGRAGRKPVGSFG